MAKQIQYMCKATVCYLLDEAISSENLNGHTTSSVTSEEVKVHIESPEAPIEEQEKEQVTGPVSAEDKTGNYWIDLFFFLRKEKRTRGLKSERKMFLQRSSFSPVLLKLS